MKSQKLELALERVRGLSNAEVYPMAEKETREKKYKKAFSETSTFVISTHFIKSIFGPGILALPSGYMHGGLIFSVFGFLALLFIVGDNMKRLTMSAAYLSEREQKMVKTYDELAYVSFMTCTDRTKCFASPFKYIINIMFFITYLHSCVIFMIFVARNVEALMNYHHPNDFLNVHHYLFFQVILLMAMCSIRELKYITPFSFVASTLLLIVVGLTLGFVFVEKPNSPWDRLQIGTPLTIAEFFCIMLFSLSGISIVLTLKSSMSNPQHFFPMFGVYNCTLAAVCLIFTPFGYLGYLKYGNTTQPSVMLNLSLDSGLSVGIKVLAIFSVFLTSPLVFYVAFNVIWNNYLKRTINSTNVLFTEFFVRYCLIAFCYFVASIFPDLGFMIILKGAIFHSHLEITFPAILYYVTYYPEKGTGKCHGRLLRAICLIFCGLTFFIGGIVGVTWDLTKITVKNWDML